MRPIYLFFLSFGILFLSCNHDAETFDGPSLIDRFGEFTLKETLAASQATVDFSASESVHFTADFSKRIAWVLQLTGKESGAVKLIEGFDSELNASNSSWKGRTSELPFFREEAVEVALIIPEEDSLTITTEITVTGSRVYEGNLVTGFEEALGTSLFYGNFEFDLTANTGIQSDVPGEGSQYYLFEGADNVVANNFAGLIRIFPSVNGETYFKLPTTVPEAAYFNFMLYGDGAPNTIAVFQFFTDTNGDGKYSDGPDQSFEIGAFPVDHIGWKIFSPTMDLTGMTQTQISEIVGIQVLLIHGVKGSTELVRFGMDYLTFTQDQPLAL